MEENPFGVPGKSSRAIFAFIAQGLRSEAFQRNAAVFLRQEGRRFLLLTATTL
jgi:hypothetical protein